MMFVWCLVTLALVGGIRASPALTDYDRIMHPPLPPSKNLKLDPEESTAEYWYNSAQHTINDKITKRLNQNVAKNVIMFLGDGMSIPTLAASRVYIGGEEAQLTFDKFPYLGLSKTYAVDHQVPDSANTATAYLCGVKANYGTIGVGPEVPRMNCPGMANSSNHILSIAYHSQQAGKRSGLVTTARVTHASPAGVYAHTANRDWECDTDVVNANEDTAMCPDIAEQLLNGETGKNLNVILGGGRRMLLPKEIEDEEGDKGSRSDGRNLIEEWLAGKEQGGYAWNREELLNLSASNVPDILGLFASDHMDFNLDRNTDLDPSLAEMTEVAIKALTNDAGFFLFVEGARIDMAHHETKPHKALDETAEFSKAVQKAIDMTDEAETLIVVTADHAHTMSFSGYPDRGNDIFEFGGFAADGKVYTTLNYANGPGYKENGPDGGRYDLSQDDLSDKNYHFPAVAPMGSETHGGDDVAVFANGPWAHLFSGVIEENVIPHLMAYASCVGQGLTACNT